MNFQNHFSFFRAVIRVSWESEANMLEMTILAFLIGKLCPDPLLIDNQITVM